VGQDDLAGGGGDDRFYVSTLDGSDDIDGGNGSDSYDASAVTLATNINLTTGLSRIGGATDTLTGIERVFGGTARDRLFGDGADNHLAGGDGFDSLAGLGGNDRVLGGTGNDLLQGGDGNDRLNGNEGRDILDGGAGNDVLIGSYDVDTFTGGAGADRFVWTDFEEFIAGTSGLERITDMTQGADQIDLSGIDALSTLAGDQAFKFMGTAAITDFGQITYRTTATATYISVSVYAPTAFEVIKLDGVLTLTEADFNL
jgi:serralysin